MIRNLFVCVILLGTAFTACAQKGPMDTLGITNGSVHMKGNFPYTKFFKKYKGDDDLVVHVWYNPSGSSLEKKEIKAGKNEVYLLYGRNSRTGLSEMDFKFGATAKEVFLKKKQEEWVEFIDLFEFDVFPGQHFNGDLALEALEKALE